MILFSRASNNASTLHFWHCIWPQSCLLTISNFGPPRCLMSCQSTCCLFYRHGNLVFRVHLGSMAWTGECMLTNVCLTIGKIKRNVSFYPYYSFTSHSASCDLWECIAGFLLWCFFSVSGCQVLLTTLEAPSVYTIPRSPWNYRILWAYFCLGVICHLESGWQACDYLSKSLTEFWSHFIPV